MLKTWVVSLSPPKPTSIACISASGGTGRPMPGVATKKSATRAGRPSPGSTRAQPPAPGTLGGVAMSPHLLGSRVASALSALGGADHGWLLAASAGFVAAFACTVGAWRAGFAAAGGRISPRRAAAGLGIGALVNSFAPAKLGDAVKIGICSRSIDGPGRLWTAGGVYAALAAARSLALALLVVVASITGAVPLWPVFALCALVAVLASVGFL